jgi:ankyrin repeat protein
MQRRQFLRSGLLFGAAGSLPGVALAASQLSANAPPLSGQVLPPLNATQMHDLLCHAIEVKNLELVKSLIMQGVDVNSKNEYGFTLLHTAVLCGSVDVVQYLISKGADVNARNYQDVTPLHCAESNFDVVKCLVAHGAEVNARSCNGYTPLHYTVRYRHIEFIEVLEYLISQGADVHAQDNDGKTALDMALERRYDDDSESIARHRQAIELLERAMEESSLVHDAIKRWLLELLKKAGPPQL